ncbi:MAG: PD-(D/E)XK nuclease family protein, partial [Spirochaetales bacterium]|nr:PD-(D/E)XK nuclease family protein [Spirochaetales bacterium]
QAKDFALSFVGSPFYADHVKGRQAESELRFYTCLPELGDIAVEGVMDLIVFGDDYNLVVDYKTDRTKAPLIHKKQITTYVKVAEQLFGKKCYGVLYYLRDGSLGDFWDEDGNAVDL